MDKESIHFCEQCNNITNIHINELGNLIYACKICSHSKPFEKTDNCIHTFNFSKFDTSVIINQNKYITHDKTIPSIQSNSNLKCPNVECTEKDTSFKYINYNSDDMKYLYICESCGQKWNN